MADNFGFTPGSGAIAASDDVGGVHYQRVKIDLGGDGASIPATGDGTNGLDVDVTRVQGNVTVIQGTATNLKVDASGVAVPVTDNSGSLTVDAPASAPVFIRPSDGTNPLSALPVSGTVAATQSGTWNVGTVTTVTGPVPVTDNSSSLTVDDGGGALTVDGAVTATQGAAAAVASAWPVKITDTSSTVGISDVGGSKALKVDVIQSVLAPALADKASFTEGTTTVQVAAGVVNDTIGGDPGEDSAAALRLTPKRGLHVNIRKLDGSELGIVSAPLRVDPTGTTTQPVLDTNSAAALTALQLIDDTVATIAAAIPAKGVAVAGTDGTNARVIKTDATGIVQVLDTNSGNALTALQLIDDTVATVASAVPAKGIAISGTDGTDARLIKTDSSGVVQVGDAGGALTVDGTVAATQSGAWTADVTKFGGSAIVAAAAGIPKVGLADNSGAAFSDTNPLPVLPTVFGKTPVRSVTTWSESQTAQAVWTPAGGKKFVVESLIFSSTSAGAGSIVVFDNSDSSANTIAKLDLGNSQHIQIVFPGGHPSSTADNVLRYTTGAGADGYLTVFGYEV